MKVILKHKFKTTIVVLILFVFGFIHFYFPRILIEPNNALVQFMNPTSHKPKVSDLNLDYKTLKVTTKDGLKLSACTIYSNTSENKGTLVLLHGIRAYKEHFLSMCDLLANKGYNTVIIDLRGHGDSEGKYCTFGHYEKYDIIALIDAMITDKRLSKNIGIWGQSLGGAIALQTMEIDPRIKFGVIESTFSDFSLVSKEYLKRLLKIDNDWFSEYLSQRINQLAKFESKKVLPKESVRNINQSTLLVHGTKDDRINIQHARINFKNLKATDKTFLKIDGANHLNVWQKGGLNYQHKVLSFIDKVCL